MKKNREQLVEENRWVVNDVISKYTHLMQRDELESAGLHGLIEGIDRYKDGKGAKVATYVRHWVRAKVLAAVYENRTVHIPWNKINKYVKEQSVSHTTTCDEYSRMPSTNLLKEQFKEQFEEHKLVDESLADVMNGGLSAGTTFIGNKEGYSYKNSSYTPKYELSLDAFSTADNAGDGSNTGRTDNIEIQSSLSSEDLHIMEETEIQQHVSFALEESTLTDLEKKAIKLRFGLSREESPMTLSRIGALTGLTTMGAQKVIKRGLNKLKSDGLFKELIR
jgi:RNA polymerase sigma factor (sigma-70 family)